MNYKIAIISPTEASDVLADTIFDGLLTLRKTFPELSFYIPKEHKYTSPLQLSGHELSTEDFVEYAQTADMIFLMFSKRFTNFALAEKINRWNKTIYIDGSELGKNRRYDSAIQKMVLDGTFEGNGRINAEMVEKCALYFRREKPYIENIIPLPFGTESRYLQEYSKDIKKDIDFFCVFGQDEYPPMRKYARDLIKDFCTKNGFTCHTETTSGFGFDAGKNAGRNEFYRLLARSKVGISIGGGGYDTGRFWEILANNCILLTETIDIYHPGSGFLKYDRIHQFINLYDLEYYLNKIGGFLKSGYNEEKMFPEYEKILKRHSSVARVMEILETARNKKIIT